MKENLKMDCFMAKELSTHKAKLANEKRRFKQNILEFLKEIG